MNYSFKRSSWRALIALPGALLLGAVFTGIGLWMLIFRGVGNLLCGGGLLIFVVALSVWQSALGASYAAVATADLELRADELLVKLPLGLRGRITLDDIHYHNRATFLYRLGGREKSGGPVIRPRRQFPRATYIPIESVTGFRLPFWLVSRMVARGRTPLGFVVTPDHTNAEELLAKLEELTPPPAEPQPAP